MAFTQTQEWRLRMRCYTSQRNGIRLRHDSGGAMSKYPTIGMGILVFLTISRLAVAQCHTGTSTLLQSYPPTTHQTVIVSDPAGEQLATFDLDWGGALISLIYNGNEYVGQTASLATGGLVQVAMHTGGECTDFNPTQAGGNPAWPSSVLGAACNGAGTINLFSSMLDYNRNLAGLTSYYSLFGGDFQSGVPGTLYQGYLTPYVIQTYSTWVANPGGAPHYYLKLQQLVTQVTSVTSPGNNDGFLIDLAAYMSATVNSQPTSSFKSSCGNQSPCLCTQVAPCHSQTQLPLVEGAYTAPDGLTGVAVGVGAGYTISRSTPSSPPPPGWYPGSTYDSGTAQIHLAFDRVRDLKPGVQLSFAWYVLPGSFSSALTFMSTHN